MDAFLGRGRGGLRGDGAGGRAGQGDQWGDGCDVLHAGTMARVERLENMTTWRESPRIFAKIDVTGLSRGQIAGLCEEARAMQEDRPIRWLAIAAIVVLIGMIETVIIAARVYQNGWQWLWGAFQ